LGCTYRYEQLVVHNEYHQLKKDIKKEVSFWKMKKNQETMSSFTKRYYLPSISETSSTCFLTTKRVKMNQALSLSIEEINYCLGKCITDSDLQGLLEAIKKYHVS
jgi:hypothetical protein